MSSPDSSNVDLESALSDLLTRARLSSYLEVTPSLSGALELYEWNMRAAASILELTGMVEVVTRNALDRQLTRWAAGRGVPDWPDHAPLDPRGRQDLRAASDRAGRASALPSRGRVIAELSFGFWRYLVSSRYHASLWVPSLHRAFPSGPADLRARRREVEQRMRGLHVVRNRAAHHEPIHRRDLERDRTDAIDLLGWVDPVAATWAERTSSLRGVLEQRPRRPTE